MSENSVFDIDQLPEIQEINKELYKNIYPLLCQRWLTLYGNLDLVSLLSLEHVYFFPCDGTEPDTENYIVYELCDIIGWKDIPNMEQREPLYTNMFCILCLETTGFVSDRNICPLQFSLALFPGTEKRGYALSEKIINKIQNAMHISKKDIEYGAMEYLFPMPYKKNHVDHTILDNEHGIHFPLRGCYTRKEFSNQILKDLTDIVNASKCRRTDDERRKSAHESIFLHYAPSLCYFTGKIAKL